MKFRIAEFFATGFYSGYIPGASGTYGTLVALPIAWMLGPLAWSWRALIVLGVIALGTWAADVICRTRGIKDPGYVVSDEIAGYLLAVIWFEPTWVLFLTGFALFRFFDILKPWPLRSLEIYPGGWGVMLDDLGASVYTAGCLLGLGQLFPQWFVL
jgi:phosphatidylglycerophosphatase A